MSPKERTECVAKVGALATKHVVPLWGKHQRHCSPAPSQLYVLARLHVIQDVWKMSSRVCNGITLGHSRSVHLFVHLARCFFSTLPNKPLLTEGRPQTAAHRLTARRMPIHSATISLSPSMTRAISSSEARASFFPILSTESVRT